MRNRLHRTLYIIIPVIVLIVTAYQAVATSVDLPKPTSNFFVNDFANVIDSEYEKQIQNEAVSLYDKTGAQVVVVTINSLNDEPLEEYANALFREWGIGSAKEDNGVLILVSIGDRMSRIEVGYGLEGALPDGKTGRIQDNYMIPYFKDGEYGKGILNGFLAIVKEVYTEYGIDYEPAGYQNTEVYYTEEGDSGSLFLVAFIIILFVIDIIFFKGKITKLLIMSAATSSRHSGGSGSFRSGSSRTFSGGGGRSGGGGSSRKW